MVVLPEPEGPTMAHVDPSGTRRLTQSRAFLAPLPRP